MENDHRLDLQMTDLSKIRRYIPSAVYKQIECGTLTYVNEMRNISTIFINGSGLGLSLLGLLEERWIVFGLPPLVHTDDPTRAVLACFDMVKVFKKLQLCGKFGVTTGRSYCGVCGSARRMEYTVLGDCVNLAARLMSNAPANSILCDDATRRRSTTEIIYNALAPIKVKGKEKMIDIFQPVKKDYSSIIGLNKKGMISFPWHQNAFGGVSSGGLSSAELQEGVIRLCSIKSWQGISKASELLGSGFRKEIHNDKALPIPAEPSMASKPPKGSPFKEGGVVVIEGATGAGKIEIAEHVVVHSILTFRMFPVFGCMGPRSGDSADLGFNVIPPKGSLQDYKLWDPPSGIGREQICITRGSSGSDNHLREALKLLNSHKNRCLNLLQQALSKSDLILEKAADALALAVEVTVDLLTQFSKSDSVLLVMQFEYGTSLFPSKLQDQEIFWQTVNTLYNDFIKTQTADSKPRVMLLMCRDARPENAAVKAAEGSQTRVILKGLETQANVAEYMSRCLNLPEADSNLIPSPLRNFVSDVTQKNPLYIRETIDQLREHHIQVNETAGGVVKNVECKDIDKVNVSQWGHTAMIGNTAAVLKMSTCFMGPFTLGDLAASTASRWSDSTHFDFLLLFQAIRKLLDQKMLEAVEAPAEARGQESSSSRRLQHFQTQNILIKSVGGAMLLEAQKKSVKRQALIDRALYRYLPERMRELAEKRNKPHIPWYYEQAFRRMQT
eukprot:g29071.t1